MTNHTRTLYTPRTATITNRLEYTRGRGRVPPTKTIRPLVVLVLTPNVFGNLLETA